VSALVGGKDSTVDPGAGGVRRQLVQFRTIVKGKKPYAPVEGMADVAAFLDGVAVGNVLRPSAGRQAHIDFLGAGGIEA